MLDVRALEHPVLAIVLSKLIGFLFAGGGVGLCRTIVLVTLVTLVRHLHG